ncbi:UNVERIFIED_CONTAM: hypothetical protein HDU68_010224 [Siphonaria sp. JEL0065]|nr:hypothetical protein HDU68_010224 [Siphonaria sp. JEL0065]
MMQKTTGTYLQQFEVVGRGTSLAKNNTIVVEAGWDVDAVVEGEVLLKVGKRLKHVRIQAEFRGYCETRWETNIKVATREESDTYKVQRTGRVFKQLVEVVYDEAAPIEPSPSGKSLSLPFTFKLPRNGLPSSFENPAGSIQYYIKVSMLYQEGMKLLKSSVQVDVPVTVLMPETARLKLLSAPSQITHQVASSDDKIGYSVQIPKRILAVGERLEVNVMIFSTPGDAKLRLFNASLRPNASYLSPNNYGAQGIFPRPLAEVSETFNLVKASQHEPIIRHFYLDVDPSIALPSMESPLISIKTVFRLQMTLDVSETPNSVYELPVVIVPLRVGEPVAIVKAVEAVEQVVANIPQQELQQDTTLQHQQQQQEQEQLQYQQQQQQEQEQLQYLQQQQYLQYQLMQQQLYQAQVEQYQAQMEAYNHQQQQSQLEQQSLQSQRSQDEHYIQQEQTQADALYLQQQEHAAGLILQQQQQQQQELAQQQQQREQAEAAAAALLQKRQEQEQEEQAAALALQQQQQQKALVEALEIQKQLQQQKQLELQVQQLQQQLQQIQKQQAQSPQQPLVQDHASNGPINQYRSEFLGVTPMDIQRVASPISRSYTTRTESPAPRSFSGRTESVSSLRSQTLSSKSTVNTFPSITRTKSTPKIGAYPSQSVPGLPSYRPVSVIQSSLNGLLAELEAMELQDEPNQSGVSTISEMPNGQGQSIQGESAPFVSGKLVPNEGWTSAEVSEWVKSMGASPDIASAFLMQEIDGSVLKSLSNDDLKNDLGVTALGMRRKLLAAFAAF